MSKLLSTVLTLGLSATALQADFTYSETTKFTGGALAGMMKLASAFSKEAGKPIETSVSVSGNRMARLTGHRGEIVDLDKETITNIDFQKKTYSTMTFAEMREAMQQAAAKAQAKQNNSDPKGSMDVKVSVKPNGQDKEVAGLPAHGMLMNLILEATDDKGQKGNFVVTSDVFIADRVAGYNELRDFNKRFAEKMAYALGGGMFSGMANAQGAQMAQAYSALSKEASKLEGLPVLSISRMGPSTNGEPLPVASPDNTPAVDVKKETSRAATNSATDAVLNRLPGIGGLGGFGRKKKEQAPPPTSEPATTSPAQPADAGVLMQFETTLVSYAATPVDPAKFGVPAGFKQVEPELKKRDR